MLRETCEGTELSVHVKPRANKSRVVGVEQGVLVVAVRAPPIDGAANEELVRFLAEIFQLARRDVVIVRGESARKKRLRIHAPSGDLAARLSALGIAPAPSKQAQAEK